MFLIQITDSGFQRSHVKGAQGCFSYVAGHMWPYKLVLHILGRCVEQGIKLYTNTAVQSVSSEKDASGRWTVDTTRGAITTKHVIFATNAYTSGVLPMYTNKIVPVRGVCCRIVPTRPVKRLLETYTLRWSWSEFDYLIPREDGSIIVGGAWSKYHQNTNDWYNNVNDNGIIESTREYFDGYMQRNFHGWENSGAYVDQIWTGSESTPPFTYLIFKSMMLT
jgi:glycine/D-amino acid oxidase-like deaminating enzyme